MEILDQAFEASSTFKRLTSDEIEALLAKTRETAMSGDFEPFKTTSIFDATASHPEWLGEEPDRFQQLMP